MRELIKQILFEHVNYISEVRKQWTKDEIHTIAKKYNFRNEFKKNDPQAWQAAKYNGWYEEVTSHMGKKLKSWDKEKVLELAKGFTKMRDFLLAHPAAYSSARNRGWLKDLQKIMKPAYQEWTKEKVHQEALKYNNKNDFRKNSKKAFYAAHERGWYKDVTSHMEDLVTHWTKEMTHQEALKYTNRSDFMKNSRNAYQSALTHGWLEDITSHMEYLGNLFNRLVYVYEFPDKSVYVGLTMNKSQRDRTHKKEGSKSAVLKHIKETGLNPEYKVISDDYIDASDAQNLENCTIEKYRNEGWNILNKAKAGGLGGRCLVNWTLEKTQLEALKYDTLTKFADGARTAFNTAKRNGWLPEITKHMIVLKIKRTPDSIIEKMSQYKSLGEFRKEDSATFGAAVRILGYQFIKDYYS